VFYIVGKFIQLSAMRFDTHKEEAAQKGRYESSSAAG
jgi:hypothetical protein